MDFAEKQAQEDRQHVWEARAHVVLPEHVLDLLLETLYGAAVYRVWKMGWDSVPVSKSDPTLSLLLSVLPPQQSHCWIHHAMGKVIRESLY